MFYLNASIHLDLPWSNADERSKIKEELIIRRTLKTCSFHVKERVFQAPVGPKVNQLCLLACAWNPHTNRYVNKLEQLQCAKTIYCQQVPQS